MPAAIFSYLEDMKPLHDYLKTFFNKGKENLDQVAEHLKTEGTKTGGKLKIAMGAAIGTVLLAKVGQYIYTRWNEQKLEGKVALITGGGGRLKKSLGRTMAKKLAAEGVRVVVLDIDDKGISSVVKEIKDAGGYAVGYHCDVTKLETVKEVAERIFQEVGNVDILINNAGIVQGKKLLDSTERGIRLTFEVNTLAHFWTVKTFMPNMIKQKYGHIVNIASIAGTAGGCSMTDYSASKFACVGFHECLASEVEQEKLPITCTCVCPYYINTGMFTGIKKLWGVIGLLESDVVAERVVTAIKRKETFVMIPGYLRTLQAAMRTFLSDKWLIKIGVASGLCTTMDHFGGHAKAEK